MKKLLVLLLALSMALSFLTACAPKEAAQTPPPATPTPSAVQQETPAKYKAGTYEAAAKGNNGDVKLSVTVDDNTITAVDILDHQETAGICDKPIEAIPADIVSGQTLAVDTVAGATNTSKAILAAVEDCLNQAGADVAALKANAASVEPTGNGQAIEKTADVIIVGGGGAGLAAAVSASDAGASVIVIEKMANLGGDTLGCGGIYNCPDPDLQGGVKMTDGVRSLVENALQESPANDAHAALIAEVQKEYDAYKASGSDALFDTANWYALQTWNGGDKVASLDMVQALCDNSFAGLEWLENLGLQFRDDVVQGAGSLYQRTHSSTEVLGMGFIRVYTENLAAKGDQVEILKEVKGDHLIQENGRIVGVQATGGNGDQYTFTANNAVILATGGFSANVEMRQKYNTSGKWADLGPNIPTTNMPGITGDGILMAEEVGANLVDMDQIQLLHLGNPFTGSTKNLTLRGQSAEHVIFVNREGGRFVREDGRRDEICGAILQQTDNIMYIIESADDNAPSVEEARTLDDVPFREAEQEGYLYIADTLAELAEKIGCDAAALQQTVDEYNASVDSGFDTYGRELWTNKILTGPFVATPRVPSVHHTMGGVQIDTSCRVLDANGSVIDGLLAAGEVTGGIHGGNRLGGNAVVDTVVFGKTAGETATR